MTEKYPTYSPPPENVRMALVAGGASPEQFHDWVLQVKAETLRDAAKDLRNNPGMYRSIPLDSLAGAARYLDWVADETDGGATDD